MTSVMVAGVPQQLGQGRCRAGIGHGGKFMQRLVPRRGHWHEHVDPFRAQCPPEQPEPHTVPTWHVPLHTPLWQASGLVQLLPSLQVVPFGLKPFGGQVALVPVQVSATSHTPAAARHTVPAGLKASTGHVALVPEQVSATSHIPADARHTVPAGLRALAGQVALLPEQVSATSHAPADARHTVPAGLRALAGQVALLPEQVSARSHAPAAPRHTVPAGLEVQVTEQQAPPSHCSPESTSWLPHRPNR